MGPRKDTRAYRGWHRALPPRLAAGEHASLLLVIGRLVLLLIAIPLTWTAPPAPGPCLVPKSEKISVL